MKRPNLFAGGGLDRAPKRRADERWLDERFRDPGSRIVPVWRARSLVGEGDEPRAAWLPGGHPALELEPATGAIFLGLDGDTAYFAVEVAEPGGSASGLAAWDGRAGLRRRTPEPPEEETPPLSEHGAFRDLHRVGALLAPADGSLLAYARGMVLWHRYHRFCGACGSPTGSAEGGHVRRCTDPSCGAAQFPRSDPAIIVLVTHGDRCVLGRQPTWPAGFYSAIAGFIEPGESAGEAVAREVLEETGLEVGGVRYHSSQPWPFPASLMLGYTAACRGGELRVDHEELEDARWYERNELRALTEAREVRLPPRVSIARRMIDEWLAG